MSPAPGGRAAEQECRKLIPLAPIEHWTHGVAVAAEWQLWILEVVGGEEICCVEGRSITPTALFFCPDCRDGRRDLSEWGGREALFSSACEPLFFQMGPSVHGKRKEMGCYQIGWLAIVEASPRMHAIERSCEEEGGSSWRVIRQNLRKGEANFLLKSWQKNL